MPTNNNLIIYNARIVLLNKIINNGYIEIKNGIITSIKEGKYNFKDGIDAKGNILMPGYIDIHVHGSSNIDFMDATSKDYETISKSMYQEGVTSFLATTLTSDHTSLLKVCKNVKEAKKNVLNLEGIHFEGPYISAKHKGAQNEEFIRDPSIEELKQYILESGNNVRNISLAVEKPGALEFIKFAKSKGITTSVGHSDATFTDVEEAIKVGLSNVTHTHNAQSGHHHRNPGVVTASFYFDELYTECICDGIHVCPNSVKTLYKIVGPKRFVIITDALKIKNSNVDKFKLFGLDCIRKDGAAFLTSGPLAGSLLTLEQGVKNMAKWTNAPLYELARISSYNAAKSIHLKKVGQIKVGNYADLVLLDNDLNLLNTFKRGQKVY